MKHFEMEGTYQSPEILTIIINDYANICSASFSTEQLGNETDISGNFFADEL